MFSKVLMLMNKCTQIMHFFTLLFFLYIKSLGYLSNMHFYEKLKINQEITMLRNIKMKKT